MKKTLLQSGLLPDYLLTRRDFARTSVVATASTGLLLSGFHAYARNTPATSHKALVFIMLDGGNDSYNMLIPHSQADYQQYQITRGNLALARGSLLPLDYKDASSREFALHPSMPEVQALFNNKKLSFVANIGPLVQPVTKAAYQNNTAVLPVGLMSHADQFRHWMTSKPGQRSNIGWFGGLADMLQPSIPRGKIPMNISLAGTNILQNGMTSTSYAITEKGSAGLEFLKEGTPFSRILKRSINTSLDKDYSDPFQNTLVQLTKQARLYQKSFSYSVDPITLYSPFSETPFSQQLKMVARSITASKALGLPRQTFFVRYIGWDHHDLLLERQEVMLRILSQGLSEFQAALKEGGVEDEVITCTGSDFGRTLTSNGNGTDHAWGGHSIVMSSAHKGGQIFGDYPFLELGNDQDIGNGVLIPTLSTDQLYGELALWFGIPEDKLSAILPNIRNFNMASNVISLAS